MSALNKLILVFVFALLLPSYVLMAAPQIGKYPNVYMSGDYIVTVVRLGADSDNTVLIKVDGIDNDFDGQIFKHIKKCDNKSCTSFKYETREIPQKKRWWTIQAASSWGDASLILYPPGIDKKSYLSKTKRPAKFDTQKFYKEYLRQKSSRKK